MQLQMIIPPEKLRAAPAPAVAPGYALRRIEPYLAEDSS